MREQYCIHTIEKIRSRTVIRMTKQQEMFRVLYSIICRTQSAFCAALKLIGVFIWRNK